MGRPGAGGRGDDRIRRGQVTFAHISDAAPDNIAAYITQHPGDYRVWIGLHTNNGFLFGARDLWGNNPTVLRRYAEFMTWTQGDDPDHATQYVNMNRIGPLYAMLRFRYAFVPEPDSLHVVESKTPPLPHVLLVPDWKREDNRDAIFAAMSDPAFDPAKTLLLEGDPTPKPEPGANGSAKIVSETPDELDIEADTDKPSILLITDLYAHGWRAEALPGSAQTSYDLMPADYILRAIPLQAGHHKLRVIYAPVAFPIGVAVSALSWATWLGLIFFFARVPTTRPAPSVTPKRRRK